MVFKSRTSVWLAIVVTALAGALFIAWHTKVDVLSWFVVGLGILLVAPAAYILIDALGSFKPKLHGASLHPFGAPVARSGLDIPRARGHDRDGSHHHSHPAPQCQ